MLFRLFLMLIYGLIGLAVASGVKPTLGFAACMRLAAIALTPVVLIDTALMLTGLSGGGAWLIGGMALAVGLLIVMVRANDDPAAHASSFGSYPGSAPPGAYMPLGYPPQQGYAQPGYTSQPYNVPAPPPPPPPARPTGY